MREIKFRYVYQHMQTGALICETHTIASIERSHPGPGDPPMAYILKARNQYTGLQDKHGVEVYEGDIVEVTWRGQPRKGRVLFSRGAYFVGGVDWGTYKHIGEWITEDEAEILGNIYENPELLKGVSDDSNTGTSKEVAAEGLPPV